jgi:hypothetical protein
MNITPKPRGNITHYYENQGIKTFSNKNSYWTGLALSNDNSFIALTFTVNGITIKVKAGETFDDDFVDFKTIKINTKNNYRLYLRE